MMYCFLLVLLLCHNNSCRTVVENHPLRNQKFDMFGLPGYIEFARVFKQTKVIMKCILQATMNFLTVMTDFHPASNFLKRNDLTSGSIRNTKFCLVCGFRTVNFSSTGSLFLKCNFMKLLLH